MPSTTAVALLGPMFNDVVHRGQYEQGQDGCNGKTPDDDGGDSALHVTTYSCVEGSWEHSERGDRGRHQYGPQTLRGAFHNGLVQVETRFPHPVQVGHHDDPILNRDTEQSDEADAARDVQGLTGHVQRDQSSERSEGHHAEDQRRLA
jgi:hypothetical protein